MIAITLPAARTVLGEIGMPNSAPAPAIWSARMGLCGSQLVPNRNTVTGTRLKNWSLSWTSDSTIPAVVKMAIVEQKIMIPVTMRSTA